MDHMVSEAVPLREVQKIFVYSILGTAPRIIFCNDNQWFPGWLTRAPFDFDRVGFLILVESMAYDAIQKPMSAGSSGGGNGGLLGGIQVSYCGQLWGGQVDRMVTISQANKELVGSGTVGLNCCLELVLPLLIQELMAKETRRRGWGSVPGFH